jgi:hypothetical protein
VSTSTPGWYADPTGRHDYRYWTGDRWSPRVADGDDGLVNPIEALAEATALDALADPFAPGAPQPSDRRGGARRDRGSDAGRGPGSGSGAYRSTPSAPRRRRPWVLLAVLLVVVAVAGGLYVVLDPGGSDTGSGSGGDEPADQPADDGGGDGGEAGAGEPAVAAMVAYIDEASGGAITGEPATCMAERIVTDVGANRLTEVGLIDGADPLTALTPEEVATHLPASMACLDDEQVRTLIAATIRPEVLQSLNAQSPQCLVDGWFDGWGRDKLSEVYGVWAAAGSVELSSILDADQLAILGTVISECSAGAPPG